MKILLSLSLGFLLTTVAGAQQVVAEFQWPGMMLQNNPALSVVTVEGRTCLKIENARSEPLSVSLLTIDHPALTAQIYSVNGKIQYSGVEGDGCLEMWSYFPPATPGAAEARYFTRTVGVAGPLQKVSGTSTWRPFALPFDRTGTSNAPVRLQINLVLPGLGSVLIGPLKLYQFPKARNLQDAMVPNGWWSPSASNWIGGIGGGVFGCLGALIGWLASRGKGRAFVIATSLTLIVFGVILLVVGGLAVAFKQPYHVWYPLLLCGFILSVVLSVNLRSMLRRYQALDLRRMVSLDAQGGQGICPRL